MSETLALLSLKLASAPKTGLQSRGEVTYRVLCSADRSELFLALVGNDGGGYFSTEAVPVSKIEDCVASIGTDKPIPSKAFKAAFVGRSSNNSGFLAAALRGESLLGPFPGTPNQHQLTGNWDTWKANLLALDGEPYVPPRKGGQILAESTPSEPAQPAIPPKSARRNRKGASDPLDASEGEADDATTA